MKQGNRQFLNLVLAEVEGVDASISLATELVNARDLVHVQVDLAEIWHVSQDVGDGG